jgi:hypothetical protein
MAKNAFFFFFFSANGENQDDHDKKTEIFLNNDGFKAETIKDVENSLYLKELQKLKQSYRDHYYGDLKEVSIKMSSYAYNQLNRLFKVNRIQISRLRLLIQPDTIVSVNKSSNNEHKYSVVRGYWIDDSGKKILKFSLSLGNTSNLMFKNGEYDEKIVNAAVKEIKSKTLELYIETYGPIK